MNVVLVLVLVVGFALLFDFTNGFHDAANAIATSVATKVFTWRQAVVTTAIANLVGAFLSTRVASTIEHGLVTQTTQVVVLAGIVGAVSWNLVTWRLGLPSSSSHALIGGLLGAGALHGGARAVEWRGVWDKVIEPMIASPVIGFVLGAGVMIAINWAIRTKRAVKEAQIFRTLQIISSILVALAHGSNDAQKTMGIITLALVAAKSLPSSAPMPFWVVAVCAVAMSLGTLSGGRRIVETAGEKIVKLAPPSGFAASATSAAVIFSASALGAPVSTTHVVIGGIAGVGTQVGDSLVNGRVVRAIAIAWVLTLPSAAAIGALAYVGFRAVLGA
ncbi:MAG: inorganic phosphate transporter [Planctomycetota bacterium]